jgi:N-methylhydantoinase B/oxoprolinase/acetone carboxylase alpha subunit
MPRMAKSRYDEGLKLPPVRIGEKFMLERDLLDMVNNMMRTPRSIEIDLRARVTA